MSAIRNVTNGTNISLFSQQKKSKAALLSNTTWTKWLRDVSYALMLFALSAAIWPKVTDRFLIISLFTYTPAQRIKIPQRLCHQVSWYSAKMDLLTP